MLLKSKEEIARSACEAAKSMMRSHIAVGWNVSPNSIAGQLVDIIGLAIEAGIREALTSIYTNEEFNRDIGLK